MNFQNPPSRYNDARRSWAKLKTQIDGSGFGDSEMARNGNAGWAGLWRPDCYLYGAVESGGGAYSTTVCR
jgi:hypothetical protein